MTVEKSTTTVTAPAGTSGGWVTFLNSLATSGGNLFLLAFFGLVLLGTVVPVMIYFGPASPSVITLVSTFGAFTGALIGILSGSRADTGTRTTTTSTSTTPPAAGHEE